MSDTEGRVASPAAKGAITSPASGLLPTAPRAGTEPGTLDSARKAMMPSIARRPLLISARRPLAFFSSAPGFAPTPLAHRVSAPAAAGVRMETLDDLKALSTKLNPTVGYWNPLALGESSLGSSYDTEAFVGFLRHAEIKHGRVAMAAFVGFCVQSNGIHFPWATTLEGMTYADIAAAGGPPAQWDAVPTAAKLQIFALIGFLEVWGEGSMTLAGAGEKHYMRGGKPGFFPTFKNQGLPHEVPFDLFDPFGFSKNKTPEQKEKGLLIEINNGRLAMLGIMAFVAEAKVPGAVPALAGKITPYSGEVMAPFSAGDASLPFVSDMLSYSLPALP